jgi:hypothetical protein
MLRIISEKARRLHLASGYERCSGATLPCRTSLAADRTSKKVLDQGMNGLGADETSQRTTM